MITSSCALIIVLAAVVSLGFVKVILPALPYETMVTALVTFGGVYLSKRIVQKMKAFKESEHGTEDV